MCLYKVVQSLQLITNQSEKAIRSYSAIAQANPNPSKVEVPRPSSSMITKEFFVAVCNQINVRASENTQMTILIYSGDVGCFNHFGHKC